MVVGGFFSSDLFTIYKVVQNTQILFAKELLVGTLREYFAQDAKYHYVKDEWGFPKVPDHTDLPLNAGTNDDLTTRIYIGQGEKFEIRYLPAVLVRHTGANYKPISFNQDRGTVQNDAVLFIDGYGNSSIRYIPQHFLFVGAWDTNFDVDIYAEGIQDRATLGEAVCMLFQNIAYYDLLQSGLFVKTTRISGETSEEFNNDKIFKQTVSIECRGEYRRIVPIESLVDVIDLCIDFGNIETNSFAPNLEFRYKFDMLDMPLNI